MAIVAGKYLSHDAGNVGAGSSYLDNVRRTYDFGDRVARLMPQDNLFFSYLANLRKEPTPDSKFMFLEERKQWQRRNFEVQEDKTSVSIASPTNVTTLKLTVDYDKYGREVGTDTAPEFLLVGQTVTIMGQLNIGAGNAYEDVKINGRITAVGTPTSNHVPVTLQIRSINFDTAYATTYSGKTLQLLDGQKGQISASAFAEASGAPGGWTDQLYDREGYTQIFKTSVPVVSGSAMATQFRGIPNEWARIWGPKLMEHKMDISHEVMFGVGRYETEDGSDPKRFTWGIVPYTELNGTVQTFTYANSGYNDFLDFLKTFLAPERGIRPSDVPLVLTSRNILAWLNKLGSAQFVQNTFGANPVLNYETVQGRFGHRITVLETIFGTLAFGEETMLRGMWEDYAILVNMKNVAYRPLAANGISRDTFIETNIQDNDVDGRKDQIITEAGLRIDLPETHAVLKWS